jgi:outer membrane protein OmpA-like peptidoglycan-associated protein
MFKRLSSLSSVLLVVSACSSGTPRNLVDARAAYQRAASGPAARLAPAQLHVAETSLRVAEKTFDDEGDSANTRDRAYVAQLKAQLAEVQANIVQDDQRTSVATQQLEQKRDQNQMATQQELSSTRAELANEHGELEGERQRRLDAERRASEAMAQLASIAAVKQEPRGTVITLSGAVIFPSGKAELLPAAEQKLDQVATALKQSDPHTKFRVEGYTDSRGSAALNQDLSTRRAAAVRDYLVSHGIPADRISSQGLGPANPVASNDTAEGRANNRRVEIIVEGSTPSDRDTQGSVTPNGASGPQEAPGAHNPAQNAAGSAGKPPTSAQPTTQSNSAGTRP